MNLHTYVATILVREFIDTPTAEIKFLYANIKATNVSADHITSNFLKAAYHKFYLVHS